MRAKIGGWCLAMLPVAACTTTGTVTYIGTSCPIRADVELKITNADGTMTGIASEYAWIKQNFPGWSNESQSLVHGDDGRHFDVLVIRKGKSKRTICFDITSFYGKF